jgi:2-oxoglutarate dehydrogenase complex dehydrogenase (E1) component-like enzyme
MTEINGTTFLSGANAEFIAELYTRYLDDPASVADSWRRFCPVFGDDAAAVRAERAGPPVAPLPPLLAPKRRRRKPGGRCGGDPAAAFDRSAR